MKIMLVPIFLLTLLSETIAQRIPLFESTRQWILVNNKIENDSIVLTPFDSSKIEINTLVLRFAPKHKIVYDYKSSVEACAGADFLDMDDGQTSWIYNTKLHRVILTVKGGYASIDDFKFRREYDIESRENGDYFLRKVKEYFFTDLTAEPVPQPKANIIGSKRRSIRKH